MSRILVLQEEYDELRAMLPSYEADFSYVEVIKKVRQIADLPIVVAKRIVDPHRDGPDVDTSLLEEFCPANVDQRERVMARRELCELRADISALSRSLELTAARIEEAINRLGHF